MRFSEILKVNERLSVEELSDVKSFDQLASSEMKTPKTKSIDKLASDEMKIPKIKSIEQLAKEGQLAGLRKSKSSKS